MSGIFCGWSFSSLIQVCQNDLHVVTWVFYGVLGGNEAIQVHMSLVLRKPVFGVSDKVPHKPGCTTTQDGLRLEISYIGRRGIVLSM